MSGFPRHRLRRLRRSESLRSLVRETRVSPDDFVLPLFADATADAPREVPSMPGVQRLPVDDCVREAVRAREDGVRGVLLFGVPREKDPEGRRADAPDGVVQETVRRIRAEAPGIAVITDVCLCEYTSHGQCGIWEGGRVVNDATLERLRSVAVSHARAGAHVVAPSDMMDGRVGAIRDALDQEGHPDTAILSYAAKYASAFYGPFRDAADSAPREGDRRGYQMDPANGREALREVDMDIREGADMVMVKPGLPYLDVLRAIRDRVSVPTAAYQVSGEYAMVRAAGERGWLDPDEVLWESTLALRRAGADFVVTYAARYLARRAARGGEP